MDPAKSTPWPKVMVFRVILVIFFPCLSYAQSYVRLSICGDNATQKAKILQKYDLFRYLHTKMPLSISSRDHVWHDNQGSHTLTRHVRECVRCRFGDFGLDAAVFIMVWYPIRMRGVKTVCSMMKRSSRLNLNIIVNQAVLILIDRNCDVLPIV